VTVPTTKPRALTFDVLDRGELDLLLKRNAASVDAVPTPWPQWNSACRDEGGGVGLARGWHVIVAGATGTGKSLLALNLAAHAVAQGEAVCYISLEMSQTQLTTRLLAIATGTSVRHLEPGQGYDAAIARTAAVEWGEMLERTGGSIRVNRFPLKMLTDLDVTFAYYTKHEPCSLFIVDYLQLCWAGSAKSMLESITEISHAIRSRAAEHRVVSIGLSQFNRQTSANRDGRPQVEGLMGGSPLENDADQVVLLDHSSYERTAVSARTKLLIGKNRHGAQVEIPVAWDYRTLRLAEVGT
jgi:replicative DNA helicase